MQTRDQILRLFDELASHPGMAFAFPLEDMQEAGLTLETLPKPEYRHSVEVTEAGNVLVIHTEG
jgi:hypothetical protein